MPETNFVNSGVRNPMMEHLMFPHADEFLNQPAQAARMHAVAPAVNQQMPQGSPSSEMNSAIPEGRPSGMPTNPLTKGSMEAMRAHVQAMRQITEPTEEDRQRAFGMGLVKWAAHQAANPPQSPGGMGLDVATAGLAPAMESYQGHLANQANQNMQLYGAVREDERYEREQKAAMAKAAEDKRRYDEKLEETKLHHRAMELKTNNKGELTEFQKRKLDNDQKKLERESGNYYTKIGIEQGIYPKGSIAFQDLTGGAYNAQFDRLTKMVDKEPLLDDSDHLVDQMEKLTNDHPNLNQKFATALYNFGGDEGKFTNWLSNLSSDEVDEDEKSAIELMFKHGNDLALAQTQAYGGIRTNQLLKTVGSTKPKAGYTDKTNRTLYENIRRKNALERKRIAEARKGLSMGYVPSFSNLEGEIQEKQNEGKSETAATEKTQTSSPKPYKSAKEVRAEFPDATKGMSDEQIKQKMIARKLWAGS